MNRIAVVLLAVAAVPGDGAVAADNEEVAALVKQFRSDKVHRRDRAAEALAKLGADGVKALAGLLGDRDSDVRARAAETLGQIGPDAKEAIPALAKAMKDRESGPWPAQALGRIGAAAVPVLIEALKAKDGEQQALAADALKQIGPAAKDAVPALVEVAKGGEGTHVVGRINALAALGRIGPKAAEAVPALIELVKGKGAPPAVRSQAAIALGQIGPGARDAVPALAAAVGEPAAKAGLLRFHAIEALGQIGPDAKGAVPALEKAVEDKSLAAPAKKALAKVRGGPGKE